MNYRNLIIMAALLAAVSCGTTSKMTESSRRVVTPTAAQADSIMSVLTAPSGEFRTYVLGENEDSRIYGFFPVKDSACVKIVSLAPVKGDWTLASQVTYPSGDDYGYGFNKFEGDTVTVFEIAGARYLSYTILRQKDDQLQKIINIFRPDQDSHQAISFTGKLLSDGKIEGSSNEKLLTGIERPEMRWALAKLHGDPQLVFISEADIMTDQAIEWWLSKNPSAITGTNRITFGKIDAASSLVASYLKAKKENLDGYRAATFNIRGYTVVVSCKKSDGSYSLVWAEPVCKNKSTDRYLNSIYQASGNTLSMFYYKGKTTFKNNLNLANGSLQKR